MLPSVWEGRAFARAALLGNPSDGYGGQTLAFTLDVFEARVSVTPADATVVGSTASALLAAALDRFRARFGGPDGVRISCRTTIPTQVGLGGSSAIVIAALRAFALDQEHDFEAEDLAAMALMVECEDLGIAAGPQDRVVQAREGLVQMNFAESGRFGVGTSERLDVRLLPGLLIAYRVDGGRPSSMAHADLRRRYEAGESDVRATLAAAAALVDRGRPALENGDRTQLADLLDENFDLRRRMLDLDARDVRMVELAREHGAGANYAGSGGAVVALPRDPSRIQALRSEYLREGFGCVSWPP